MATLALPACSVLTRGFWQRFIQAARTLAIGGGGDLIEKVTARELLLDDSLACISTARMEVCGLRSLGDQ
jgi:hypothetical protein